ncbi:helix-turn-helix domain-containing protein [Cellvibrio sp. OA-2007]|uniref:helix-turn-helix domain-containing protein n=1 Tax=Cellvibrio sp. OA-2007 TaxID=529823 RepID=UPI0007843F02|nr:helix-turn-helix transcriptional regulator [Cellvibrio sp. OA-2007]
MLIRKLREDRGISQEQLAEAAHLSLRTIQRVEAGHRVSYASLRALAATFAINVDLLERELYAMNSTTDEYNERPLWVRLILGLPSLSRLGRPELIRHEAFLVAYALFAYAASFIVARVEFPFLGLTTVDALYLSAFSALFVAYLAAISLRLRDKFNAWTAHSS